MYIKTFKLKQHTPIIHFQSGEKGATLRASEVKPKLDKFLIKRLGKDNINKEWKRRDENGEIALDYGLKIVQGDLLRSGQVEIIPPKKDKWIIAKEIKLTVRTKLSQLGNRIEELLPEFFATHNFGKRQSKGFGSFSYNLNNTNDFEQLIRQTDITCFKSNVQLRDDIQLSDYFYQQVVSKQWNRLKSGKNHNGYEKSRVFRALKDEKLRWDKRFIKKELNILIGSNKLPQKLSYKKDPIDIDCKNRWEDITNEEYRFGRAMLGLAEHYEFRANGEYLYNVKVSGENVERFKSPITFKIFYKNIYMLLEEIPNKMFNQKFSFSVTKKKNKKQEGKGINIEKALRTPTQSEFSLEEFANKYLETIGYENLTQTK